MNDMSDNFREKYGYSTGIVLDTLRSDKTNQELGDIYEVNVFGQDRIDMFDVLDEYHMDKTEGAIKYKDDMMIIMDAVKFFYSRLKVRND